MDTDSSSNEMDTPFLPEENDTEPVTVGSILGDFFSSHSQAHTQVREAAIAMARVSLLAGLGSFTFGLGLAATAGDWHFVSLNFELCGRDRKDGMIPSNCPERQQYNDLNCVCMMLGGALGSFLIPRSSCGPKQTLWSLHVMGLFVFSLIAASRSIEHFLAFRVLTGVVIGGFAAVVPMYLAENLLRLCNDNVDPTTLLTTCEDKPGIAGAQKCKR